MVAIVQILQVITSLLPIIGEAMQVIEAMFPHGGQGALKFKMLSDIVENAAKSVGVVEEQIPALLSALAPIASGFVTIANATGVFKSTPKAV